MTIHRLLALFERNRESCQPLVLCTVISTAGSTYAKPGAQMLIAADGEYAGLLSGGCLEGDLREHARAVAASGQPQLVSYDLRSSTDQLFGLGAGCEGAMDILLTRVSVAEAWQPLAHLAQCTRAGRICRFGLVTASNDAAWPRGMALVDPAMPALRDALAAHTSTTATLDQPPIELFVVAVAPPPRMLLAGAGPDARPVATLAAFLGWDVLVVDHRASYLDPVKFPPGIALLESRAAEVANRIGLDDFAAAVVMSHHLESDLQYLRSLAHSRVPYVGLLGPAARREKLLGDLGEDAALLRTRLRAPVGLDIGGRSPESIALSIVGEVHAALAGRGGRPFSEVAP
ncbi:MAG TPA: XdhC family protein [Steroidobacteraceae bacterium]